MIKANKTKEQKVDLLKKNISLKIKDLAFTLSCKINNANYKGQSKQMDVFTYNLQNYTHYTKLNTAKLNTASGYQPVLPNNNTLALALQNNLIDLNAVEFGGGSSSLLNDV